MSELAFLVAELENGSTDLASCLLDRPNLARADQVQLVLADQKIRLQRGEPCSVEHYSRLLPWLAEEPTVWQEVIANEFELRLGELPSDRLLQQFATRYPSLGNTLLEILRARMERWHQPSSPAPAPPQQTRTFSRLINSHDLTGSFISNQTVGDLRAGRYRFERKLGQGAYGAVYLAQDTELKRQVAVKVPSLEALEKLVNIDSYLVEAQTVAALDHPHIVTVYDVGRTLDGSIYVVSKFIDGCSLADWIKTHPVDLPRIAKLLEPIASALHHAHERRLIHRDIKPANILIEEATGAPYVTDFGLAIHEEDYLQDGRIAGTPAYMSPEQVRGEGHRLDGRSDLFSLGVIMYLMLTGRLPFPGQTHAEIAYEITSVEPLAPRSLRKEIPAELERICLKLLRKRASERYANGRELAGDLHAWLNQRTSQTASSPKTPLTPRGLRSFTADDAGFYLDLLPGPRDRNGVPESIAFWKERLEQRDPDQTFPVGLLYGPSGCGKSSLVKAGLIPNLSPEVSLVYLEATPEETESRLLRQLQKRCPDLATGGELAELAERIRRSEGPKIVFIIDQFEQWLYSHRVDQDGDLIRTLRQCDGRRLQAVLMIRDDFYLAAARLMNQIDVPIITDHNFKLVDLFEIEHAKRVLTRLGESYGKLPLDANLRSPAHEEFIQRVADGLSENGKVVSVRLALLADMLKGRDWIPETLESIGGLDGIGISFLEETFASSRADARHRAHQVAVRGVLRALLPDLGTDLKGSMRSEDELLEASGYAHRRQDFDQLMRILDGELRLLTPTASEGHDSQSASNSSPRRFFQLTHDYLVPSLREWLTRKQRETSKGRAELKLAERAAAWKLNREEKQLPTLLEWRQIRRWTEPAHWQPEEKAMMQRASRHHLRRLSLTATAVLLLAFLGWFAWRRASSQQEAIRIAGLVDTLTNAEPARLPEIIKQLDATPQVADEYLAKHLEAEAKTPAELRARLHARLAKVSRDPSLVEPLFEELLAGKWSYILPIRELLRPSASKLTDSLQRILQDPQVEPQRRFRAALALVDYTSSADDNLWSEPTLQLLCRQLVTTNAEVQPLLRDALRPIQGKLLSQLEQIFSDPANTDAQRLGAANALADFAANDPARLTRLLTLANPEQYAILFPAVTAMASADNLAQLSQLIVSQPPDDLGSVPRIAFGQQRANAAVTMLRIGDKEKVLPVLDWTDDPEALMQFIFRCKPRGVEIGTLIDLLNLVATAPADRFPKDSRYALLLAIGEYGPNEIPIARREKLVKQLADWYATDPSSGVHGAAGWLLRHLGEKELADRIDQTPVPYSSEREWFTRAIAVQPNREAKPEKSVLNLFQGKPAKQVFFYTFIVVPQGDYTIGAEADEPERRNDEVQHPVKLSRSIALLDREITYGDLLPYSSRYANFMKNFDTQPTDAGSGVDWYDAVAYCRWLGQETGLPESEQSYADPETLDKEKFPRDAQVAWAPRDWPLNLDKTGFRLPTEAEWEVATRSGMRTAYNFGGDPALLNRFGWFLDNGSKHEKPTRELRPSLRGFFDLHGNQVEWTHDWSRDFDGSAQTDPLGPSTGKNRVLRGGGWDNIAPYCRTAFRAAVAPSYRDRSIGFRLAFSLPEPNDQQPTEPNAVDKASSGVDR